MMERKNNALYVGWSVNDVKKKTMHCTSDGVSMMERKNNALYVGWSVNDGKKEQYIVRRMECQ